MVVSKSTQVQNARSKRRRTSGPSRSGAKGIYGTEYSIIIEETFLTGIEALWRACCSIGGFKFQIQNSKFQTNPNTKITNPLIARLLDFGFWPCLEFGILDLEFLLLLPQKETHSFKNQARH